MSAPPSDRTAREHLQRLAAQFDLDVGGGKLRRTSSRFCLGVEHGEGQRQRRERHVAGANIEQPGNGIGRRQI